MTWTMLVRDPLFEMQGCELVEAPEIQGEATGAGLSHASSRAL